MKLVRFRHAGRELVGEVAADGIVPFDCGPDTDLDALLRDTAMAGGRSGPVLGPVRFAEVELLSPVPRPASIRDFLIYPEHLVNASGKPLPDGWHDRPGFYFTNPHVVHGPDATVTPPRTRALDFELELGILIGRDLTDADPDEAAAAIAGFTVFNDFSARDLQSAEAPLGLGPSKGKDFAHAVGPTLVTPDELRGSRRRPEAVMTATVNGRQLATGRLETMYFDLGIVIAYASRDSVVRAGDLIGSGTVTGGCLAEYRALHGRAAHSWLRAGDVVELEISGIGVLRNRIGEPTVATSA